MKIVSGCAFAAIFTLNGCIATNDGGYRHSSEVEARLMQMSETEVASLLGAPTSEATLSNGTKVWTYRSEDETITGGMCTVTVVLSNGRATEVTVLSRDRSPISAPLGGCQQVLQHVS